MLSDEEMEVFGDGLKETIPLKLEELLERLDLLKKERSEKIKIIHQKTKNGSDAEYFLTFMTECRFSEAYIIQKWLGHWLQLWQIVTQKPLPSKVQNRLDKFDKFEVERAKQYPIEDLYDGQLKKTGRRLTGLCPFHKESTPSFFIFPDHHFHCYGCGEHGDTIAFLMKLKGLTFPEAVRSLL